MVVGARGEADRDGAVRQVTPSGNRVPCAKPSPTARLRLLRSGRSLVWLLAALAAASVRASAAPAVGAYLDLAGMPAKAQADELSRLVASGVTTLRMPLDWNRVEPKPTRFTWKADDAAVNAARARKLDVVLILGPNAVWAVDPAWQVPAKERRYSLPKNAKVWERYVRQAAMHFRGRVRYWQVREQPNARNFRGARSEYLRAVASAARTVRAVEPSASVIVPEAGALDIAEMDRLCCSDCSPSYYILGAYLPSASGASETALAWAVVTSDVCSVAAARKPIWVLGADGDVPADSWMEQYLLANAYGSPRFYMPASAVDKSWAPILSQLRYSGYLRLGPDVWALVCEDTSGPVVVAWSVHDDGTTVSAGDLAPIADADAVKRATTPGGQPGSSVVVEGDATRLRLSRRPTLIRGLDTASAAHAGPPRRDDVLAARPATSLDLAAPVSVDYGRSDSPERGLYNRSLRNRIGGHVAEEMHDGRMCLRTKIYSGPGEAELDNPWVYFDVDDRWLYFAQGKTPVAVTIECQGSSAGAETLGFNIWYDSTTGYRFSPWQWIAPGSDWKRYRVELPDVSFADRHGYDFRINIKGSKQDMWISSVTVEKLDAQTSRSSARSAR